MPRCADCHWLENAPPSGRKPQPCVDAGELPQNKSCGSFVLLNRDREPLETFTPLPVGPEEEKAAIGALLNQNYEHIFGEVIAESFALEQDGDMALKTIQYQLQAQGANIVLEGSEYKRTLAKMIDLYVTYRLACATGLGAFASEIMSKEIERRFRHIPDPPTKKRP